MDDRDAAEQIEKILSSNAAKAFSAAYRRFSEDFDAKNLGAIVASFLPVENTNPPTEPSDWWEGHTTECSVRSNGITCNCGWGPYAYSPPEGMFPTADKPPMQEEKKTPPASAPDLQNDWFRIMDSVPGDLLNLVRQAEQYSRLVEVAKLAGGVADMFSTPEKKTTETPSSAPAAPASYVGEAYLAGMQAGEQTGALAERARIVSELEEARQLRRKESKYVLSKQEEKLWKKVIRIARDGS